MEKNWGKDKNLRKFWSEKTKRLDYLTAFKEPC